ncbi:MAG: response regulator [Sphingomonadales bacterium]|nr:response regulator [Sphingomonadales bacterium]
MTERIIVVDDDPQLTGLLDRYLSKQGFEVTCAATAAEFAQKLAREKFDLCVLDLILPDRDGFEITKELRLTSAMPIIVLTARSEVFDRVVGLELGADDYLTKPFEPRELLARIKAVLRRTREKPEMDTKRSNEAAQIVFGNWRLDCRAMSLVDASSDTVARLTAMEFALIKALAERPNVVLTRDQLIDLVHGEGVAVADRAIDVHIARLRRKIERDPADPLFVKTVRGRGYVFVGSNISD